MSHSGGYFTDTEYEVFNVFPPMTPAHINFLCSFKGVAAPDFSEPFSYCELGSGQGYTLAMLAALHPQGRFVGVDFSAGQVRRASELAAALGLDNVVYVEASFADFAEAVDVEFDVIALHGVWTWVSRDIQRQILAIVERALRPAGLFHVSMNTMPGWASTVPFQRLMLEQWRRTPNGDPGEARKAFRAFFNAPSQVLAHNPHAKTRLEAALSHHASYFAHEFLNEAWQPVYFQDAASDFASIGLRFGVGGRVRDVFDAVCLSSAQRAELAALEDPIWREAVKDFYRDEAFRQDNYTRGEAPLTTQEQLYRLASSPIALIAGKAAGVKSINGGDGELAFDVELKDAFLERLGAGAATLNELIEHPLGQERGFALCLQTVLMLHAIGAVEIGFRDGPSGEVAARAASFNAFVLDSPLHAQGQLQLASPVLRMPVATSKKERVYLKALAAGLDPVDEVVRAAQKSRAALAAAGHEVRSRTEQKSAARADFEAFERDRLPILRHLGIGLAPAGAGSASRRRA